MLQSNRTDGRPEKTLQRTPILGYAWTLIQIRWEGGGHWVGSTDKKDAPPGWEGPDITHCLSPGLCPSTVSRLESQRLRGHHGKEPTGNKLPSATSLLAFYPSQYSHSSLLPVFWFQFSYLNLYTHILLWQTSPDFAYVCDEAMEEVNTAEFGSYRGHMYFSH